MKKSATMFAIGALLMVVASVRAQEKLERGKDRVDTPAIGTGLCLSNLFQSDMVIQRDKPITIWGWAEPGEAVTVSFGGQDVKTTATNDRSWKVALPAMKANAQGQLMTIRGEKKTLSLKNILIGDVWVIGGQSNMQFELARAQGGQTEIVSAHFPKIRLLTVPALIDNRTKKSFPSLYRWEQGSHCREGYWDICSPETVRTFSAIGYVFGRRLYMASQIPIGLIDASRWGTTVEAWTPLAELKKLDTPEVKAWLAQWDKKVADYEPQKALQNRISDYNRRTERYRKEGRDVSGRKPPTVPLPSPITNQNYPGNCYASMIAPLAGFGVKGAIFHQGFNNSRSDAAEFYYHVFPKMISSWRAAFNDPDMAFGIISLCTDGTPQTLENYTECMLNSGIYVREAQYKTFLNLYNAGDKNIGFASSFDLRRAWYHPQHKLPAGERIARWALATQYGLPLRWKPPMVTKVEAKKDKILIHVDTDVGAVETGAAIVGFAIAGNDKKFEPADAEPLVLGKDGRGRPTYDHKVIVLTSPDVPHPFHYRYAWGRNPMGNLRPTETNQKDILFATQRSDDWKFWEVPFIKPPDDKGVSRASQNTIREALKLVDLERRLKDAERRIETIKPRYIEQLKQVEAENQSAPR